MGDITEMMEEGILCAQCGVYMGDDRLGIPFDLCDSCKKDTDKDIDK